MRRLSKLVKRLRQAEEKTAEIERAAWTAWAAKENRRAARERKRKRKEAR